MFLTKAQPQRGRMTANNFSPRSLFAGGVNGVWYDPSDFSTMFQDSAGTTPVTAVEQPVGKILDKSGRGNHAIQATSTKRPVLSARVNLLTKTEDFSNAVWGGVSNYVIDKTSILSPIGTMTGNKITGTATGAVLTFSFTATTTSYKYSIYVKAGSVSSRINFRNATTSTDLISVNYNATAGSYSNAYGTYTVEDVANGWKRLTINCTAGISVGNSLYIYVVGSVLNNGEYVYAWGADLRPLSAGVNLPVYQRVGTSTDYDTVGFQKYLKFDGIDDSLNTASTLNMSANNEVSAFAGATYRSLATDFGMLYELTSAASTPGATTMYLPYVPTFNMVAFAIDGTSLSSLSSSVLLTPPTTKIITGIGKISTPYVAIRVNGTLNSGSTSAGTGNFANDYLYVGARAGTAKFSPMDLYQLVIANKNYSSSIVQKTERFINRKTLAY